MHVSSLLFRARRQADGVLASGCPMCRECAALFCCVLQAYMGAEVAVKELRLPTGREVASVRRCLLRLSVGSRKAQPRRLHCEAKPARRALCAAVCCGWSYHLRAAASNRFLTVWDHLRALLSLAARDGVCQRAVGPPQGAQAAAQPPRAPALAEPGATARPMFAVALLPLPSLNLRNQPAPSGAPPQRRPVCGGLLDRGHVRILRGYPFILSLISYHSLAVLGGCFARIVCLGRHLPSQLTHLFPTHDRGAQLRLRHRVPLRRVPSRAPARRRLPIGPPDPGARWTSDHTTQTPHRACTRFCAMNTEDWTWTLGRFR